MVNTKTTPRKTQEVRLVGKEECVFCDREFDSKIALKAHIVTCLQSKAECSRIKCELCSVTFKKKAYLRRHMKTIHSTSEQTAKQTEETDTSNETIESEDLDQYDPGKLIGEISDDDSVSDCCDEDEGGHDDVVELQDCEQDSTPPEDILAGRIVRKKTMPSRVFTPKKKSDENTVEKVENEKEESSTIEEPQQNQGQKRGAENMAGPATTYLDDPVPRHEYRKVIKIARVVKTYVKDGQSIEDTEETTEEWYEKM